MLDPAADLDALRAERGRLVDRISWWEDHRHSVLVPLVIACFAAGYGAGWGAHLLFGIPYQAGYLTAIAFVFVAGRVVERRYSPLQLHAIDARIARAERLRTRTQTGGATPPARG